MNDKIKSYSTVAAGALIMSMLGAAYVWGVYKQPLSEFFGVSKAAASIPFSLFLAFYTVGMITGGRLQDKYGPKNVCTVGAALFGAGYFASGFAGTLWHLLITYGAVVGFGTGLAYVTPVAAATKWFPKKKGLASGVIVFGFGAGAFFLAPIARAIITAGGATGWAAAFKTLGVVFFVAATILSRFIEAPATGVATTTGGTGKDIRPAELFSSPVFYSAWIVWFLNLMVGLGTMAHIVNHAGKIGITPMRAAAILSVIAAFNGAGRIAMGALSDKIGRATVFSGAALAMAAASLGFSVVGPVPLKIYALCAVFGISFGSFLVLYPAMTAELFGTKYLGTNYGILFSSYGLGGIVGPIIYGRIFDLTGGYALAFSLGGAASAAAFAVSIWLGFKTRRAGKI